MKQVKLTPVEWELMEAIWELGGAPSVREVLEFVFPNGDKAYTTVQTVMNTMERKGVLRRKKTGLVNFYSPAYTRDRLSTDETSSLVKRVFGGSAPALASSLLSLDSISLEEIGEIKSLLRKKERELKGRES
ncbi:MAG: BlaI/MecI/CopY family transcriptional regulator [bacterium]|nr:BlaI/MecI/CopY family transcriptional regulator [bacterium]